MPEQRNGVVYRRDCPDCGREIMAAATRCGYCWSRLEPLAPGSAGTRRGRLPVTPPYVPVDEALRRDCPHCGRRIMAAATVCGFCWTKLGPPKPGTVAVVAGPPKTRELPHGAL